MCQNPFGIFFHPLAIEKFITDAINERVFNAEDAFLNNEQWHCFDAHSKLSDISKAQHLENLNENIKRTHAYLKEATHIIMTLGTAWTYRHIASDTVVANCHKVPQKAFLKELLSIDEIESSLASTMSLIKSVNPKVNFIFTVSPVRHLKDGFIENMRSKAHLISALHQNVEPRSHSHYFPAYEIMNDELRDYRFYTEDMIHPNPTAINIIWEKFQKVWIVDDAKQVMSEVDVIQKGMAHKPFHKGSEAHLQFLENLETKKAKLQQNYTHIKF
jgi:lysophospholipase L1-like esterase